MDARMEAVALIDDVDLQGVLADAAGDDHRSGDDAPGLLRIEDGVVAGLADGELYLLAAAHRVLWVGTLDEIVAEALARSQFRLALGAADSAFRVAAPTNEIERMTLVWDLEGAEPATGLSLA